MSRLFLLVIRSSILHNPMQYLKVHNVAKYKTEEIILFSVKSCHCKVTRPVIDILLFRHRHRR